jgi:hypothetical protein
VKKRSCPICGEVSSTNTRIITHMQKAHPGVLVGVCPDALGKDKRYYCRVCGSMNGGLSELCLNPIHRTEWVECNKDTPLLPPVLPSYRQLIAKRAEIIKDKVTTKYNEIPLLGRRPLSLSLSQSTLSSPLPDKEPPAPPPGDIPEYKIARALIDLIYKDHGRVLELEEKLKTSEACLAELDKENQTYRADRVSSSRQIAELMEALKNRD